MGEVYRARDTRLDRTVAVKILPAHLSSNAEARQRFDREARTISSLSHPNICHLYDVGQQDETSFLVMEYLEGETLADRLVKGPLPVEQVLKYGIETCEGLERAHKTGLIHRDLKPGNIMLTKSGAKLMDFGLAKPVQMASSGLTQTLPTPQQPLTTEGAVVGTFQYMAPEQLEGKEADTRSDIFSLGAVLYEMATGQRAFSGKSAASTIAAILAAHPPAVSSIQPLLPSALDHLIKSCLAKDPDERLQTVHDVKMQLQWIAQGASQTPVPAGNGGGRAVGRLPWLLVALLLLVLAGGGVAWWSSAHRAASPMYFSSVMPFPVNDIALSPDGRRAAVVAYWEAADKYVIWIHEIGSRNADTVSGTEGASHPFWSPDGRFVGFFADGKLKKVDLASHQSPQILCDAPNGRGGTWNRDGVILFAPDASGGLYRVSSAGGAPVEVTKVDASRSQSSNRWPYFLPDQKHFLYLGANFSGEFDKNAIFVGSLDSSETHMVVAASSNAAYADPGFLLYVKDTTLVAQPFDLRSYSLMGEPHAINDQIQYFQTTDLAVFSVFGRGTLLLQTGKGANKSQLLWFDRSGKQLGAVGPLGRYRNVSLSPDGRRVLFDEMESDGRHYDIWMRDVSSEATARLTFGPGLNQLATWSPDGKQIVYTGIRKSSWMVFVKNSDGSGSERQIVDNTVYLQGPWDWSRDGRILIWRNGELWYVTVSDRQPKPIFQGNSIVRNAQFSPDEKWIAYSSNETGTREVYVSQFPRTETKWQVSRGGGAEPRWRRDGKELFYLSGEGKMIAVPVKADGTFEAGSPAALFQTHLRQPISAMDQVSYDVTADGRRFLIDSKVDDPDAAPLSVVLNWAAELDK